MARKRAAAKPSKAKISPALLRAAADGAAMEIPLFDETYPLGFFAGVTGDGFSLVNENGALILIAVTTGPLTTRFVHEIEKRCELLWAYRPQVDARWRAQFGPAFVPPPFTLRIVAANRHATLEKRLSRLPTHVDLRIFSLPRDQIQRHEAFPLDSSPKVHPLLVPLLLEARRSACDALRKGLHRDRTDWRTCHEYNALRVYGILVSAASRLTVLASNPSVALPGNTVAHGKDYLRLSDGILPLLADFVAILSRNKFHPSDRVTRKALKNVCTLVDSVCGPIGENDGRLPGAFNGIAWTQPVPDSFSHLLSCMTADAAPADLSAALTNASDGAANAIAETHVAVVSSAHIGQTFDNVLGPSRAKDIDAQYIQAATVRVLTAHRVLLELLQATDRQAVLGILATAKEIAGQDHTFAALLKAGKEAASFIASVRDSSLAILETKGLGTLQRDGNRPAAAVGLLAKQEKAILRALRVAFGGPA